MLKQCSVGKVKNVRLTVDINQTTVEAFSKREEHLV